MFDFFDWSYWLGVALRRLKWPLMLIVYVGLIKATGLAGLIFIGLLMGAGMFALHVDKQRDTKGADDFWGEKLFFRYGHRIYHTSFSIPVKPDWSSNESAEFAETLRITLANRVRAQTPEDNCQIVETGITEGIINIIEKKVFLKIIARSRRGSQLTHFVHYAPFGGTITAHYFTYIRGRYYDWDVLKFVAASPYTMWLWGVRWLLNRHSICSELSHFRDSSFDTLDLQTMLNMTHYLLWKKTEEILKEDGLLTEELMQVIYNNISQNISVHGSSHVQFGNVGLRASVATPNQKAA